MRQQIIAFLLSVTILWSTIYLNNKILPQNNSAFVDYFRQHVFGDRIACASLWDRINFTELGFTGSPNFGKYAVSMYEHLNWKSSNIPPSPINCSACTNLLLKEVVRNNHQIPSNGTWLRYVINKTTDRYHFHPRFCSFSEKALTKRYVRRCLAEKNIRKIVTLGDSNSQRLMEAFARVLSTSLDRCSLVAVEAPGFNSNPKYYLGNISLKNLSYVSFRKYQCRRCGSTRYVCFYSTTGEVPKRKLETRTLELEQIKNTRIIDGNRVIKVKLGQFLPTNISQEFILRDYFRADRYPDIILYQTPFMHENCYGMSRSSGSIWKLRDPLKKLHELIVKYVPRTTSVYWMSNQKFGETDPRAFVRNPLLRQSISLFSKEMESVLGSKSNNIFPFFDLFELSRPVKSLRQAHDWAHMKPEWYDTIAKYILELHCNS